MPARPRTAPNSLDGPECQIGLGQVRSRLHASFRRGEGFTEPVEAQIDVGKIRQSDPIGRMLFDQLLELRHGLLEALAVRKHEPEIGACRQQIGIQRDRAPVGIDRLVESPGRMKYMREIRMSGRKMRVCRNRSAEMFLRHVETPGIPMRISEIEMCRRVVRFQIDGTLPSLDRLIAPIQRTQRVAEIVRGLRERRAQDERALDQAYGLVMPVLLVCEHAQQMYGIGMVRCPGQNIAVSGFGGGEPSGPMVSDGCRQQGRDEVCSRSRRRSPCASHVEAVPR